MTDRSLVLCSLALLAALVVSSASAKETDGKEPPKKITFEDDVLPIFRARCGACHNASDRRGGLQLDDYSALLEGGGSGDVVFASDVDSSYLWMVVNHDEEPVMPPNAPKLPENELALIRGWIEQGILKDAGSKAKKAKPNPALAKVEVSFSKPEGPLTPARYLGDPALVPSRAGSVTALAVSPWASIAAVSGHQQVVLWDITTQLPLGTLPFPEGQPNIARFSRNGKLLLVGGGRGGMRGEAALFDVLTGDRIATLGNEYDALLAADLSPDLSLVAVGGPKKVLRVHATSDNAQVWEATKHTDWVTAAAFSPDGVLLASGDRSGGLVVWEAETGREFYVLPGITQEITSVAWRADGNVLAASSLDNNVRLFDMNSGREVKKFNGGVGEILDLDYSRDGKLAVTGRNRRVKVFDAAGKQLHDFGPLTEMGMRVACDNEGSRVLAGDWNGRVHVFQTATNSSEGQLVTNPQPLTGFVKQLEGTLAGVEKQLAEAQAAHAAIGKAQKTRQQAFDKAQADAATAKQAFGQAEAALKAAQATMAAAQKSASQTQTAAANAKKATDGATTAVATAKTAASQAAAAYEAAKKGRAAAEANHATAEAALKTLTEANAAVAESPAKPSEAGDEPATADTGAANEAAANEAAVNEAAQAVATAKTTLEAAANAVAAAKTAEATAKATQEAATKKVAELEAAAKKTAEAFAAAQAAAKAAGEQVAAHGKTLEAAGKQRETASAAMGAAQQAAAAAAKPAATADETKRLGELKTQIDTLTQKRDALTTRRQSIDQFAAASPETAPETAVSAAKSE